MSKKKPISTPQISDEPADVVLVKIKDSYVRRDCISMIGRNNHLTTIHAGNTVILVADAPEKVIADIWPDKLVEIMEPDTK